MDPQNQAAYEMGARVGAIFGALLVGAIVGCIPRYRGRSREDHVVGNIGFVACMVGAFFSGILGAGSMAIGFVIAILVGGRRA
jgi:hypothetical protein